MNDNSQSRLYGRSDEANIPDLQLIWFEIRLVSYHLDIAYVYLP